MIKPQSNSALEQLNAPKVPQLYADGFSFDLDQISNQSTILLKFIDSVNILKRSSLAFLKLLSLLSLKQPKQHGA